MKTGGFRLPGRRVARDTPFPLASPEPRGSAADGFSIARSRRLASGYGSFLLKMEKKSGLDSMSAITASYPA